MRRREFLFVLSTALVASPLVAGAQQAEKPWRIGFLRVGPPPAAFIGGFQKGLREQNLVEGRHFVIEYAIAKNSAQVTKAAMELVDRKVDIIIASGTPSVMPARDVAGNVPVVFVATLDPVATGLVVSLARPGRNVTGMTSISGDLIAKRLELVRELLPRLTAVAILVREASPTAAQYVKESQAAARNLGIGLTVLNERDPGDIDRLFSTLKGADALVIADDAEFTADRARIAELALEMHLPTISGLKELAEAGGLIAYGASFGELYRRAASHVHRILQGTSPSDLPVEQPAKFELVLNMRTAKAIGLAIPPSVLARADEIIE
jgi:putative tryptophan/tyrosine transport system substrate-binding protein